MTFYGTGTLRVPGTTRIAWDFTDGPFETVNPVLIEEAHKRGFSTEPPVFKPIKVEKSTKVAKPTFDVEVKNEHT